MVKRKGVFCYGKLTNQLSFEINFQKLDQHTGGKWLIHDAKYCKDNQFQSLESPVEYPSRKCKFDINESDVHMFNPIF